MVEGFTLSYIYARQASNKISTQTASLVEVFPLLFIPYMETTRPSGVLHTLV